MENEFIQYKQKFVDDALELLNQLESDLLILEKDKKNKTLIDNVFRAMHTLKGVSAMFGFEIIGEFTHKVENIYDLIRCGKLDITKEIINFTLQVSDHIRNLLNDGELSNLQNKENHKKLEDLIANYVKPKEVTLVETKIINAENKEKFSNYKTYNILINPKESYFKRNIKLINIFNELFEIGEYQIKNHLFEKDEVAKEYISIYLATESEKSKIEDILFFIIDDCEIHEIANFNIFNNEEFDLRQNTFSKIDKIKIEEIILNKNNNENIEEINTIITEIKEQKITEELVEDNKTLDIQVSINQTTNRISVDSKKLDKLMHLVSELIIANAQLNLATQDKYYKQIWQYVEKIEKLSKDFKINAFSIRLVPLNDLVTKFQRLIRDLSSNLDKEIEFITQGTENELDKNIIDVLAEPLMHIIRNCIDHGIESTEERKKIGKTPKGLIKLTSYHSGTNIFIQVSDDGKGIDSNVIRRKAIEKGFISEKDELTKKQMLELIFLPGLSTAQVISEISGRGVGMDVVKKRIEQIRGEIDIETEIGLGTSFTIKLHQTISIIDSLLVQISDTFLILPLEDILVCKNVNYEEIIKRNFFGSINFNGDLTPFVNLREIFNINNDFPEKAKMVYVKRNEKTFGVSVDKIIGQFQTVLKPLDSTFKDQKYISAVSILGDGNLALMLDINALSDLIINKKS